MVNLNIILTVIIISIILIILILLTLNYFNKIENFSDINGKYGYICSYNSPCTPVENTMLCVTEEVYNVYACGYAFGLNTSSTVPTELGLTERVHITNINDITVQDIFPYPGPTNFANFILTNNNELLISGNNRWEDVDSIHTEFTNFSNEKFSMAPIKK